MLIILMWLYFLINCSLSFLLVKTAHKEPHLLIWWLIYFTVNITANWILKFPLNWAKCLIFECKFITGFGHQRDIWPISQKKIITIITIIIKISIHLLFKFLFCLSKNFFSQTQKFCGHQSANETKTSSF